jgi:hypothetical protein
MYLLLGLSVILFTLVNRRFFYAESTTYMILFIDLEGDET